MQTTNHGPASLVSFSTVMSCGVAVAGVSVALAAALGAPLGWAMVGTSFLLGIAIVRRVEKCVKWYDSLWLVPLYAGFAFWAGASQSELAASTVEAIPARAAVDRAQVKLDKSGTWQVHWKLSGNVETISDAGFRAILREHQARQSKRNPFRVRF